MTPEELSQIGRTLGRWLAPYVAEHLAAAPSGGAAAATAVTTVREDRFVAQEGEFEVLTHWDDNLCRIFVRELGDTVVQRAEAFFRELEQRGELTSVDVKELLGLPNQRSIGANLTVSLRKRVKSLGLDAEPWEISMTPDGERTIWRDRAGIAARMHAALKAEARRRNFEADGGQ